MHSAVLVQAVLLQAAASDPVPSENNVVAGRAGAIVFVLLIVAVALLLWSFTRQLKKARAARDAGVFGDEPAPKPDQRAKPQ